MHLVTFLRRIDAERLFDADDAARSMGEAALGLESLDSARPGARRLGAVLAHGPPGGDVVDLNRALAIKLAFDDVGAPEAEADSLLPSDMAGFLRRLPDSLDAARAALAFVEDSLARYDAPDVLRAGVIEARRRVHLCAPLPRPGKILGVARNYREHAAERGDAALPREPVLFHKAPSAVIGPEEEILLPEVSQQVDYEGELVVVMGATARRVEAERALEHVAGYCVGNDVSARDFQNVRGQHFVGKSCDTFAPMGPALVTADEVPDPQALSLRTLLSQETVQSGSTKEMIFSVAEIIAFASRLMTLEPGDAIFTGTPAGVGAASVPPRWLRDGDLIEVEIERLGRLYNHVRRVRSA